MKRRVGLRHLERKGIKILLLFHEQGMEEMKKEKKKGKEGERGKENDGKEKNKELKGREERRG